MTDVSRPQKRWPRVLLLIALSLVLHLLLVDWSKRHLITRSAQDDRVFTVELRPVPPPQQPVSLPQARPPAAKSAPKKTAPARRAPSRQESIEPPDEPIRETVEKIETQAAAPAASTPATADAGAASGDDKNAGDGNADGPVQAAGEPANTAGAHYNTNPPPTARLEYDVLASYNQMPVHGYGTLDWKTDGKTYRLDGKAEDFLFTFLNFSSSGDIDGFGVSPELYTEKRMRKSATNTHFNRERNTISFSSSTESYPRNGGEQDRASLIWQLSAIGRGDAGKYQMGAVIDLFVAGARDGEVWRIQVLGEENIKLPIGELHTWHVVRMPKPGSYDQRIDIWLAPQHEWYPVRLRYTDPRKDGDFLDMALSEVKH
ncbi:DUF3108 domain-containing protein [Herbaspirillum sp. LeCh32-8]|uniref:DUF3108 domain-containing protein n=1 Tax=Herbaspirillum sp. LeCh32-8 TaxID=2821356 RepID=UPI001AE3503F|nr:DUF3108 domain-containing protein [Herbaspirillum sp. LeCh32-8]MBP0600093.1 DUF3108 domain-containing protein [Herbaspirillum sp. LeCh32-8]